MYFTECDTWRAGPAPRLGSRVELALVVGVVSELALRVWE